MADEGVRTLYAPRETTTVWRKADEPGTTVVATRKQLDPSGTALVVPTRDYASTSGVLDPPRYAQSGMVQVQIVKHDGTYLPLVDGLVPPREVVDGEVIHLINHHRGMFEDEETRTWVFSPCAVSVCIEDGQALPERCAVSVWQRVVASGAVLLTEKNRVKLGERELRPLRVSDPTASTVYVPYPGFYTRPPRIIINDMTTVMLSRQKGFKAAVVKFLSDYGVIMMALLGKALTSGPSSLYDLTTSVFASFNLANFFSDAKNDSESPRINPDDNISWFDTFWLLFVQDQQDATTAAEQAVKTKIDNETSAMTAQLAAGVLSFWALVSGLPGALAAGSVLGTASGVNVGSITDADRQTWSGFAKSAVGAAGRAVFKPENLVEAGVAGISEAVKTRVQPLPAKRYFTIAEFATVIESLGSVMSLQEPELAATMANEKFTSEAVVLQWLLAAEPGVAFTVSSGAYGLSQTPNRVDLSEFSIADSAGIQTDLCLQLEDDESTDACEGRPKITFRFSSARDDKRVLGHVMSGLRQDLKRLQDAIYAFDRVLKEETNPLKPDGTPKPPLDYTRKNSAWTWFDYWIFDPIFASIRAKFEPKNPNQGVAERDMEKQLGKQRSIVLKYVRDSVQSKLHSRFTTPHSEGATLMKLLNQAEKTRFLGSNPSVPTAPTSSPTIVRELPHKLQNPVYLFPSSSDMDTNFVDVQLQTGIMREYSPLHDATKVGTRAARAASSAIVTAHRKWETEGPRSLFVHAFEENVSTPFWTIAVASYSLIKDYESYSLVLQLPSDIRAAEASEHLDEEMKRRILTLCHTGPAAEAAGTLLAHSKLPDTEAAFVAMSLFAELWTDELLKLHQLSEPTSRVVSAVQTAQVRAARRCVACGTFLEAVTVQSWSGLVPLSESATADPALLATQAGRDAARLARRLQLVAQPVTARGVLSKAIVRRLRAIGATLVATGNRLATKPDADVLPSEPLQALFMKPVHGLHAYARATALSNLDPLVATAIAAAYPSSLLMSDQTIDQTSRELVRVDATPQRPPVQPDAARIVQRRMAALRFDYPDTVHLDETTKALHASDKALVDAMSSLSLASQPRTLAFYVPYGYGQAPPRLVYPPVPAPMFGSVPVWTEDVLASIDTLLTALDAPTVPTNSADTLMARICPVFPCGDTSLRPLPAHPSLLEAHLRNVATNAIDVCFWASEPELGNVLEAGTAPTPNRASEAAKRHVLGMQERKLASRVCTLAWNAERILQSLLLLVGEFDDTQLVTSLILGDGDARIAVPRRGESDEDMRVRLERELEDARYTAERDANWHFAELRRTMNIIESYIETSTQAPPPAAPPPAAPAPAAPAPAAPAPAPDATATDDSAATNLAVSDQMDLSNDNVAGTIVSNGFHRSDMDQTTGVSAAAVQFAAYGMGYAWSTLQDWNPELFTVQALIGVGGTAVAAAAAWKGKKVIGRARKRYKVYNEAQAHAAKLRSPEYDKTAASKSTTVSKGCDLPFLRYDSDDRWQRLADPNLSIDQKRELLNTTVDEDGNPRFADSLRSELERLRNTKYVFIEDLVNGKNCPPTSEIPWQAWAETSSIIVERALYIFLDDEITQWKLAPGEEAQAGSLAVSNPASKTRRDAYETVKNNVSNLIGPNAKEYAAGVNLIFYGAQARNSLEAYRSKKRELDAHVEESKQRASKREQVRQRVRMHVIAAGIVGNALARGIVSNKVPQINMLMAPNEQPFNRTQIEEVRALLSLLKNALGSDPKGPSSLRLSELCAIVQSVLID